jgi:hypothetical protein
MRVAALLRGWLGYLLVAVFCGVAAAFSFTQSPPSEPLPIEFWTNSLLAATCIVVGFYQYLRHPSGQPPRQNRAREEPDFAELLIYGILAVTVVASIVMGFGLLPILHAMQR